NATKLVKYFKSHPQVLAKLRRIQLDNYNKEIALVLPNSTIDASLRIYALCDEFWEDLDLVTNILQPIVAILKIFELDNTTLLSIYSNFRKMINTIQDISCNFLNEIQSCIEAQWNYVYHLIMMVAYMLDPRFLEESRTCNIEPIGYNTFNTFTNQKFGQEKSVELFVEIVKFRNKSSLYDDYIIWESAAILNLELWPDSSLKQLAIKVLKIPMSSATTEQNFSTFGFIHSKLRNRLNNGQVKKLVYIYENLRMCVKKLVNSKNGIKINNSKTNQEINHEIYDKNREVENIIYTEGICGDINETEQIYSFDIENNSTMELESEYGVIYT
ncbi:18072_t:CDS:2, partial [Gigaspora margarita]